jgi:hypothetical protein
VRIARVDQGTERWSVNQWLSGGHRWIVTPGPRIASPNPRRRAGARGPSGILSPGVDAAPRSRPSRCGPSILAPA